MRVVFAFGSKFFLLASQSEPSLREKLLPNKKYSLSWTWNVPTPNNAIHGGFKSWPVQLKQRPRLYVLGLQIFRKKQNKTRSTVTFGVVCFIFFTA